MFVLMSYYFFCKDSARLAKSKVKVKKLLISFYECNPLLSALISLYIIGSALRGYGVFYFL